ncbi:MAG: class 3 adenylate cyclase [Verrucomicrobiales bacterium]|jgi:class 3 adenylate cyclase
MKQQPEIGKLQPGKRAILSFLFADIAGYSKIPDHHLPEFFSRFSKGSAAILRAEGSGAISLNTWGDALFAVFVSPADAASAALSLREWSQDALVISENDGESNSKTGIQETASPIALRISLHAGPVIIGWDDVIKAESFIGHHVVRAARLEPIAESGQILATEEFAALLACLPEKNAYRFEYQGVAKLPKNYGQLPVYRLERGRSDEEEFSNYMSNQKGSTST